LKSNRKDKKKDKKDKKTKKGKKNQDENEDDDDAFPEMDFGDDNNNFVEGGDGGDNDDDDMDGNAFASADLYEDQMEENVQQFQFNPSNPNLNQDNKAPRKSKDRKRKFKKSK